ncbi:MAG: hypothetical protein U0324_29300 [Polyangiales bacterium]
MSDATPPGPPPEPKKVDFSAMIDPGANTTVNAQSMVRLLQDLAAPWAGAEKAKHEEETKRQQEETKRAEIESRTTSLVVVCATAVLLGVLVLSGIALAKGAKEVTEKVLQALITSAGGYLAGRGHAAIKARPQQ